MRRLRPATEGDRAFLVDLYAGTRGELALVDWDDTAKRAFVEHQFSAQDEHYRSNYPGATLDVIEVDGERAGRLYVHRGEDDIRIMDIAVAPAFRGRGIGTAADRGADRGGALQRALGLDPRGDAEPRSLALRPARLRPGGGARRLRPDEVAGSGTRSTVGVRPPEMDLA